MPDKDFSQGLIDEPLGAWDGTELIAASRGGVDKVGTSAALKSWAGGWDFLGSAVAGGPQTTLAIPNLALGGTPKTITGDTHTSTTVDGLSITPNTTYVGRTISGSGIPVGTTITAQTSTTLTLSAAATTTVAGGTLIIGDTRDLLDIRFVNAGLSASDAAALQLNGDTGSNYTSRHITWVIAAATTVNNVGANTSIRLQGLASTGPRSGQFHCANRAAVTKGGPIVMGLLPATNAEMPLNGPSSGAWVNTTQQIVSLTLMVAGGGATTLAAGSALAVFGRNFA